jgi:hypothetical protein
MVFFNLWVGPAENYILGTKFGGLVQRWGTAGLGGGGATTKSRGPAPYGRPKVVPPVGGETKGGNPWSPALWHHGTGL